MRFELSIPSEAERSEVCAASPESGMMPVKLPVLLADEVPPPAARMGPVWSPSPLVDLEREGM